MKATLIFLSVVLLFTSCTKYIEVNPARSSAMASCDSIHEPPPDTIPPRTDTTPVVIGILECQSLEEDKTFPIDITVTPGAAWAFKGLATRAGAFVPWEQLPNQNETTKTSELHFNEATFIPAFINEFYRITGRRVFIFKYAVGGTIWGWQVLRALGRMDTNSTTGKISAKALHWSDQFTWQMPANKDYPLYKQGIQVADSFLKRSGLQRTDVMAIIGNTGFSNGQLISNATMPVKMASDSDFVSLVNRARNDFPNASINWIESARADGLYSNGFDWVRSVENSMETNSWYHVVDRTLKNNPVSMTVDGLHLTAIGYDSLGVSVARNIITLNHF